MNRTSPALQFGKWIGARVWFPGFLVGILFLIIGLGIAAEQLIIMLRYPASALGTVVACDHVQRAHNLGSQTDQETIDFLSADNHNASFSESESCYGGTGRVPVRYNPKHPEQAQTEDPGSWFLSIPLTAVGLALLAWSLPVGRHSRLSGEQPQKRLYHRQTEPDPLNHEDGGGDEHALPGQDLVPGPAHLARRDSRARRLAHDKGTLRQPRKYRRR